VSGNRSPDTIFSSQIDAIAYREEEETWHCIGERVFVNIVWII
jgi:hypothetical protein